MTITNQSAYIASLWDWGCLNGCFGDTKIKVTDIDGLVERHGHFLFIETKLPGVEILPGQNILINELIKSGRFIVLLVWGHPGKPERIQIIMKDRIQDYNKRDSVNMELFRWIVSSWFKWADSK